MNIYKWNEFYKNELQPEARKLTYTLSVLCRYIGKNSPLSPEAVDALGPQLADIRIQLNNVENLLTKIETKQV